VDRLASIRLKIERAYEHIHHLERSVVTFGESNPYLFDAKHDPETGNVWYLFAGPEEIPSEFSLISSDVLFNLRSALDHLAYQLVIASGNQPDRRTAFPIFETVEEYETNSPRKIKLMSQTAQNAIRMTKPYKGGNDLLWRLDKLHAIDKHRLLVTVATALGSIDAFAHFDRMGILPPEVAPLTEGLHWKPVHRKPLKVGDVLFISPSGEVDKQMEFRVEIALYEPGTCECEPLIETLHSMADLVRNIVSDFIPLL
jgi:hypothetical protein